jgi:drug/metabolite transporter (DMT)-like permease
MPVNIKPKPESKPKPKLPASATQIAAALIAVYIIWGTTYLGLAIAVETLPPLLTNATRFVTAGLIMLAIARAQGHAWPTRLELRNASVVGVLMVTFAMSCMTYAGKLGIGSGLAATVVTTSPMWLMLWSRMSGERIGALTWFGLLLGALGAVLLAFEGDFRASVIGGVVVFLSPFFWSLGSFASRKLTLPAPAMASAVEWIVGGALLLCVAVLIEPLGALAQGSARSWAAWFYLVVFGTLVAFNAYLWLLGNTSASVAISYSFANPAVALFAGVLLNAERLTGSVYLALPLIFVALAVLLYGEQLKAIFKR